MHHCGLTGMFYTEKLNYLEHTQYFLGSYLNMTVWWYMNMYVCMFSLGCHGNRWLNFWICTTVIWLGIFFISCRSSAWKLIFTSIELASAYCIIFLRKFTNQLIYLEFILPVQSFITEKPVINLMLSVEHKKNGIFWGKSLR